MPRRLRQWGPGLLLLSPSLILLAVFVYGLIGWTINLSLQDKHDALPSNGYVGTKTYTDLFTNDISDRFVHSLKNLGIFTARAPIIFFFDGEHEDYHQLGDSADKIDYQKMERVTRTVYMMLWEVTDRATRVKVDKQLPAQLQQRAG